MRVGLLLALVASQMLFGCQDGPASKPGAQPSTAYWVTCQGTVRFVSYSAQDPHSSVSRVIIETDDHVVFTVGLLDPVPPVWVGLRGQFVYESAGSKEQGLWKNFIVKKRLPEAEVKK